jgi:hypothetical protein
MIAPVLIQFYQNTVTRFWVDKDDTHIMSARRRFVGKELVTFSLESLNIRIKIIAAKTQMMETGSSFFQVICYCTLSFQRVHQFNASAIYREKCGSCLGRYNVFGTLIIQLKILQKSIDGTFQIRDGNSNVIQRDNHI